MNWNASNNNNMLKINGLAESDHFGAKALFCHEAQLTIIWCVSLIWKNNKSCVSNPVCKKFQVCKLSSCPHVELTCLVCIHVPCALWHLRFYDKCHGSCSPPVLGIDGEQTWFWVLRTTQRHLTSSMSRPLLDNLNIPWIDFLHLSPFWKLGAHQLSEHSWIRSKVGETTFSRRVVVMRTRRNDKLMGKVISVSPTVGKVLLWVKQVMLLFRGSFFVLWSLGSFKSFQESESQTWFKHRASVRLPHAHDHGAIVLNNCL